MERNRPLAGRYRFLRLLPGRAKTVTWTALDDATGASVVASVWPAARIAASLNAKGLKHERLAGIVEFVHKFTPQELPENAEVPKDGAIAVAEWIQGVTLHDRLRTVRTPLDSVQCVAQVASVIGMMHQADCVHGAVSTRAVLLQRADGGATPSVTQVLVPPDGACFSPERVRGAGVSMQDDVWALHVMLYMTLTAQRPFTGGAAPELARSIIAAKPRPLSSFDAGDNELQRILTRGFGPMTKRMRRADEMVAELNAWIASKRPAARPRPAPAPDPSEEPAPPSVDTASLLAFGQRYSRPDIGDVVNNVANLVHDVPGPSMPVPYDEDDDKTELIARPMFEEEQEPVRPDRAAATARPPRVVSGKVIPKTQPARADVHIETPPPARKLADVAEPESSPAADPEPAPAPSPAADPEPAPAPSPAADPEPAPAPEPAAELACAPEPAPAPEPEAAAPAEQAQPERRPEPVPVAAAAPAASSPSRPRTALLIIGGLLAGSAVAAGAYFFFRGHPDAAMTPPGIPSAPQTAPASVEAPSTAAALSATASASATPTASAALSATASASATPTASMPAPVEAAADPSACIAALFPPDTFSAQPDLKFVCEEPDVRKGGPRMRARIVFASRGALTQGMDEWSRLGWYELPVWATLRGACCGSAVLVEVPETGGCEPLGPSVVEAARAMVARDRELSAQKLAAFEKVGMCLQFQETKSFKYTSPPRSGGQIAFGKFMNRALSRP